MAEMLINLRSVPDDEQAEIRALLDENNITYYETHAGFWGIGTMAIWLSDESQYQEAKQLLAHYQEQRSLRMKEEYRQAQLDGTARTLWSTFKLQPFLFSAYIAIIILLLAFFLLPFLSLY